MCTQYLARSVTCECRVILRIRCVFMYLVRARHTEQKKRNTILRSTFKSNKSLVKTYLRQTNVVEAVRRRSRVRRMTSSRESRPMARVAVHGSGGTHRMLLSPCRTISFCERCFNTKSYCASLFRVASSDEVA